jgi:NhaP-type Na+/H+ or K+/H+ antiporter
VGGVAVDEPRGTSLLDREDPFSTRTVWLGAVAGIVLSALAGYIFLKAVSTPENCQNQAVMLVTFALSIIGFVAGLHLLVSGIVHAIAAGSWSSLAVPFAGLALIAFSVSWVFFYVQVADFSGAGACD